MSTFVLVPGAWLGAWAWSDVGTRLTAAGHDVHPVTLTGLADRRGERPAAAIDLSTHVADVEAVLSGRDLHDVVLVVHSYAGVVGGVVADRVPERLSRVVYLATWPLAAGQRLFDLLGPDAEAQIRAMAVAAGDPDLLPLVPDDLLAVLYPGHGMTAEVLAQFRRRATPHPLRTYSERVTLTRAGAGLPRTLVWCSGDGPLPVDPAAAGGPVVEITTGHWPMLTHPALLARTLLSELEAPTPQPTPPPSQ